MKTSIQVSKNEAHQSAVPTVWRPTIVQIVEAIKNKDFELKTAGLNVRKPPVEQARAIEKNIISYGKTVCSLTNEVWDRAVSQWMRIYWDVLVDLCTEEEGISDLALSIRIYEIDGKYIFDVHTLSVP